MEVTVFGAGAVGCYYGGMLARAGHQVEFIGRASHVNAINAKGLLLDTQELSEYVSSTAAVDTSAMGASELVLVAVKSADTEAAAISLKEKLSATTMVLSLQNGVDNANRLSDLTGGHPVFPTIVYVGAEMAGAGHVKHLGRGELVIGRSAISDTISKIFSEAGIPVSVDSDISKALWIKLIYNCAYNALSAVGNIPYRLMLETEGTKEVMASAINECIAVACACGVSIEEDIIERVLALADTMPEQRSSTAQDFLHNRPSEIDFLNGFVVRKGHEFDIPTPTNQALQVAIKLVENGRQNA
ncbi:MAG: ketopantoate reductase family protein [Alphaproteobacteria bacterium]|jgi:2-dehydropantoate 2-reductase|nr:ketopantoate reductase family protein [Alphaproteobacteria bacterium]MBT4018902.1 ketopantoate reductase family protein [Alphaproteobacteria bacterium]